MKKNLLFLTVLFSANIAFAQNTYYWVGGNKTNGAIDGSDWNTQADGLGAARTTRNNSDILIVDGNVTADIVFSTQQTIKQLQIKGGAVLGLVNNGNGNVNLNITGDATTKSLLVTNSVFKIDVESSATGNLNIRCEYGGEISNSNVYAGNLTTIKNIRIMSSRNGLNALEFTNGSNFYAASNTGVFGQNATTVPTQETTGNISHERAVVFKSGTNLYYLAGNTSPFGNNQTGYSILNLENGSNFIYKYAYTGNGFNLLRARVFANLIIDEGASYQASTNGDVFTSAQSLQIRKNATLMLRTNGSALNPVMYGNVVLEEGATLDMNVHSLDMNTNSFTTNSGATIVVNNANGVDGVIIGTGTKTFHANTIYSFSLATTTPFSSTVPKVANVAQVGGIIVNVGTVTLTDDVNILAGGKLQFGTGSNPRLAIGTKNLTLQPGAIMERATVGGRVVLTNNAGKVYALGVTTPYLLAVGTTNDREASVTLEPASASDFSLGINLNVPNTTVSPTSGTDNYVQLAWYLERTVGSGNFKAKMTWQDALERNNFNTLPVNNISLYQYDNSAYSKVTTTGGVNNTGTDNYVEVTLSNGGVFVVAEGINTLPVELTSFAVKKQGNSTVITWSTASESNNSHFDIERSTDGNKFIVVGTRKGADNSSSALNYSFTDYSPISGINYYRLVQYDIDGKSTDYKPQAVSFDLASAFTVLSSTNKQEVKFKLVGQERGIAQINLYAIDGRLVSAQKIAVNDESNTYSISVPQLISGVYVLQYQLGSNSYKAKILR